MASVLGAVVASGAWAVNESRIRQEWPRRNVVHEDFSPLTMNYCGQNEEMTSQAWKQDVLGCSDLQKLCLGKWERLSGPKSLASLCHCWGASACCKLN